MLFCLQINIYCNLYIKNFCRWGGDASPPSPPPGSIPVGKASGPDGIPPRFLREFADELAPVLCRVFRLILKFCTYPSSWKYSFVQPVP